MTRQNAFDYFDNPSTLSDDEDDDDFRPPHNLNFSHKTPPLDVSFFASSNSNMQPMVMNENSNDIFISSPNNFINSSSNMFTALLPTTSEKQFIADRTRRKEDLRDKTIEELAGHNNNEPLEQALAYRQFLLTFQTGEDLPQELNQGENFHLERRYRKTNRNELTELETNALYQHTPPIQFDLNQYHTNTPLQTQQNRTYDEFRQAQQRLRGQNFQQEENDKRLMVETIQQQELLIEQLKERIERPQMQSSPLKKKRLIKPRIILPKRTPREKLNTQTHIIKNPTFSQFLKRIGPQIPQQTESFRRNEETTPLQTRSGKQSLTVQTIPSKCVPTFSSSRDVDEFSSQPSERFVFNTDFFSKTPHLLFNDKRREKLQRVIEKYTNLLFTLFALESAEQSNSLSVKAKLIDLYHQFMFSNCQRKFSFECIENTCTVSVPIPKLRPKKPTFIPSVLQNPLLESLNEELQTKEMKFSFSFLTESDIIHSRLFVAVSKSISSEHVSKISLACTHYEAHGDIGTFFPSEDKILHYLVQHWTIQSPLVAVLLPNKTHSQVHSRAYNLHLLPNYSQKQTNVNHPFEWNETILTLEEEVQLRNRLAKGEEISSILYNFPQQRIGAVFKWLESYSNVKK